MDESLLGDFITETQDLLQEMETSVLRLEENRNDKALVDDIFRSIHTIKGSSEYLGMARIAEVAHKLENLLDLVRQKKRQADGRIIQLLMDVGDRIGLLLKEIGASSGEETSVDDLVAEIEGLLIPVDAAAEASLLGRQADGEEYSGGDSLADSGDGELAAAFSNEDEELFAIFMEQFKEGYLKLKTAVEHLSAVEEVGEVLTGCIDCISSLRSSANYMGYDQLCQLYDQWIEKISSFESVLNNGGPDRLTRFVEEGIRPTANKLAGLFPEKWIDFSFDIQIPKVSDGAGPGPQNILTMDDDSISSDLFDDLAAEMKDPDNSAVAGETRKDDFNDEELSLSDDFLLGLEPDVDTSTGLQFNDRALLEDFIDESEEHLHVVEISLLSMLNEQVTHELIDNTFRSVHTIKGSAEYLGLKKAAELLHKMENILDLMRHGKYNVGQMTIETLIEAKDITHELVESCMDSAVCESIDTQDLLERLSRLMDMPATETVQTDGSDTEAVGSDAGQGEQAAADIHADLDSDVDEDFQEDYDKELYDIFLEQFDGDVAAIRDEIQAVPSDQSIQAVLKNCLSYISKLRSSANYMGYDKLRSLYDLWRREVEIFLASDAINDDTVAAEFLTASMAPWVEKIQAILHPSDAKAPSDAALYGYVAIANESNTAVVEEDILDNYALGADSSEKTDTLFDPASFTEDLLEKAAEKNADKTPFSVITLDTGEKDLFKKLESAFNASMPQSAHTSSEDENGGQIVSGLFSSDEHQVKVPSRVKKIVSMFNKASSDGIPDVFQDMHDEILRLHLEQGVDPLAELYSPDTGILEDVENLEDPVDEIVQDDVLDDVPQETAAEPQGKAIKHNIRVDASKVDLLMNQVGELVVNRSVFTQLANELRNLQQYFIQNFNLNKKEIKPIRDLEFKLSEATVSLGRVANELQEGVMKVRMLPISQLFNRYPRLVHDLTRNSNKKVKLDVKGAETELDRMVIEEISDPLIHIIRNAVDHGIETGSTRKEIGKPEAGTISLDAYHESNHVIIEIVDDGKGLDLTKITEKAIQSGIISEADAANMTSSELSELITVPGFSTADEITHTSGRGVGMDVVKKNIELLNGTMEIDSTPGKGTKFRIKIPLTLAIFPALLVRVGDDLYTIPLSLVEETIRIEQEEVTVIEGVEVIHLRDEPISLLPLPKLFNKRNQVQTDSERLYVVIVNKGKTQIGLIVDELIGQEEVVIKPLEDYLQENSGFSGATILGDGQISLILDVHELVKIALDRKAKIAAETVI